MGTMNAQLDHTIDTGAIRAVGGDVQIGRGNDCVTHRKPPLYVDAQFESEPEELKVVLFHSRPKLRASREPGE